MRCGELNMRRADYSQYREFHNEAEVENWAWTHYGDLLGISPKSKLYEDIFAYTGSLFTPVNRLLRYAPPYGTLEFSKYDPGDFQLAYEVIPEIAEVLNRYKTPEDIVAYRFTQFKVMKQLCETRWLRSRLVFSDKAFLSTTLLRKQLLQFGKDHRCNCVLKLYLPKGTHGAYVSFKDKRDLLREYEFLLPPNTKFEILKVWVLTYPRVIECVALVD